MDFFRKMNKAYRTFDSFILSPLKELFSTINSILDVLVEVENNKMAEMKPVTTKNRPTRLRSVSDRNRPNKVVVTDDPLYVKRGWSTKGNTHSGYFRTKYGAWKGNIVRRGDKFDVNIFSPPKDHLEKHPKWVCFTPNGRGKYNIHLHTNPNDRDIGAIIFYVEKIINESFQM
jgi:hypothetical protein